MRTVKGMRSHRCCRFTQDSVQEFRVTRRITMQMSGRSSGAQVALVTKAGTNAFHGSVSSRTAVTGTSANDYFVKLAEIAEWPAQHATKAAAQQFWRSIRRADQEDRLFFFANYEATDSARRRA